MEEQTKKSGTFWKIGFFTLLAVLIIGANIFAWYFFLKSKALPPTGQVPAGNLAGGPTPSPIFSPVVTIIPTPTPAAEEANLIKQAVFKLTGLDATRAEVTINRKTDKHGKGTIKEFEAVGGAYWIAAKTTEGWVGVYAGQAQPSCAQIAPYNFPKDMVPECLDASGNVVSR
ncbi:hypothetical protein HZB97_03045 [Candidatus Gottesmanbacteria bacterium]|nr:hypothetical protein [Candidatus Gottesmanbacteria bacterium]